MPTTDLEKIWADHIAGEFTIKDVEHTGYVIGPDLFEVRCWHE